eukprot:TRINITY_DN2585_c0_g1_i1.p1 TRINITY_DN2585_c0_g1~~TRINITY_DN2585_c0_g1_i1.p1  ORF type:complete len:244 (-),score=39.43 TRINITY_DN2585_c0_g1_i1:945-1676(-)
MTSTGIIVSGQARSLARTWVKDANGAQPARDGDVAVRPSRLGLGASFVPHSATIQLDAASRSLQKHLNRRETEKDEVTARTLGDDNDGEDESRVGSVSKRVVTNTLSYPDHEKQKKRKKVRQDVSLEQPVSASGGASSVIASSVPEASTQSTSEPAKPKSRRGKRSRLKNLKRDTRPVEKRPTYLDEVIAANLAKKQAVVAASSVPTSQPKNVQHPLESDFIALEPLTAPAPAPHKRKRSTTH